MFAGHARHSVGDAAPVAGWYVSGAHLEHAPSDTTSLNRPAAQGSQAPPAVRARPSSHRQSSGPELIAGAALPAGHARCELSPSQ